MLLVLQILLFMALLQDFFFLGLVYIIIFYQLMHCSKQNLGGVITDHPVANASNMTRGNDARKKLYC